MFGNYVGATLGTVAASAGAGTFASIAAFGLWHDVINHAVAQANLLWLAPIGIGLAFVAFRKLFQSTTRTRARELRATFEAVVELAHRHRVSDEQKLRVEVPAVQEEVVGVVADHFFDKDEAE